MFAVDPRQAEFVSGHACVGWKFSGGGYVGPTDEVDLPAAVLKELPAQMTTATNEVPDSMFSGGGLVLLTQDGDPLSLYYSENGMLSWFSEDGTNGFFTPTGTLADELDKVFDS